MTRPFIFKGKEVPGQYVDERNADDITVTMIRHARQEGLFRYFEEHHVKMMNPYADIYYILDTVLFPTQIIVGKELDWKSHTWLSALSDKVQKQQMKELLERNRQFNTKNSR